MRFWDTSAIVPLCVSEPMSRKVTRLLKDDEAMAVWWATRVECTSALARRFREGSLDANGLSQATTVLDSIVDKWTEVQPVAAIRDVAERLLRVHPLRAADALQLAAALIWAGKSPRDCAIVCLDQVIRDVAVREGFIVVPPKE